MFIKTIKYTDEIQALQEEISVDADKLESFFFSKLLELLSEEDKTTFRESREKIEVKIKQLEKLEGEK